MSFEAILIAAKCGEAEALSKIIEFYFPLIAKASVLKGVYHEDLEHELIVILLKCVKRFNPMKCL